MSTNTINTNEKTLSINDIAKLLEEQEDVTPQTQESLNKRQNLWHQGLNTIQGKQSQTVIECCRETVRLMHWKQSEVLSIAHEMRIELCGLPFNDGGILEVA